MGQGGFGAHSEAKLFSQFMQTKFLCHKMSQNSTAFSVSYSSDFMTSWHFSMTHIYNLRKCSYFSNSKMVNYTNKIDFVEAIDN